MRGQFESLICHSPIAFEEAHFEAAYLPTAVAFDVVVRLVGSVAPVAPEAVFAVAPAAAVEVSADHLGTRPKQSPPIQRMDPRAGRKASQEQRQGTTQANTTS
jgi:hypothetical protein